MRLVCACYVADFWCCLGPTFYQLEMKLRLRTTRSTGHIRGILYKDQEICIWIDFDKSLQDC